MEPVFFPSAATFRTWLRRNHRKATELWVGYYKVGTGVPSMTWTESVDEALCFGWIDGVRRRVDDERYAIRFTPRKPGSRWSAVNVKRVAELAAAGRLQPPGSSAFEARSSDEPAGYSYEQRHDTKLDAAFLRRFRAQKGAWAFFAAQPPSYRHTAIFWVTSAKKPETRERRLAQLISDSAAGRRLKQFARGRA